MRSLILASIFLLGATLSIPVQDGPAQCKVKWLFGITCQDVYVKLVTQIKTWQLQESCFSAGDQCSYELVSATPYLITATHTSSATKKVNDLQFLLEQSTICKMTAAGLISVAVMRHGEATSEGPVDDTNYCSLQNLINGSDLNSATGYKQFSNKWICPGFDTATCVLP